MTFGKKCTHEIYLSAINLALEKILVDDFVINVAFADARIAVNDIEAAETFREDISDN